MALKEPNPTTDASRTFQSNFVAPIVLVSGVACGLLLVIALLFCKYCVKKNNCPRLQTPSILKRLQWGKQSAEHGHQYESVASTVSVEQAAAPQLPVSTGKPDTGTTTDTLRVENEIDAAVAAYRERLKSFDEGTEIEDCPAASAHGEQRGSLVTAASGSSGDLNRHVSFILSEDKCVIKDSPKHSPARNSKYTEGDFHHLKSARIERPGLSSLRSLSDKEASVEEVISELTPMLSPVSEEQPITTQVKAEIHVNPNNTPTHLRAKDARYWEKVREISKTMKTRKDSLLPSVRVKQSRHMLSLMREEGTDRQAASLELWTPHERWVHQHRKVKSYEEDYIQKRKHVVDYDRSSITEFDQSIMCSTDLSSVTEGLSPEVPSKARYNDIGSFEDISESQMMEELPGLSDSETETVNGTHKYKELWNLRSTLEEDEELSDTVRMEDMMSPDMTSPDEKEPVTSLTTSFESNTEPINEHQHITEHNKKERGRRASTHLLHPNYEHRRRTYQFSKRPKSASERPKPGENSFDSFETMDTDGDVSESSRQEVTTTSFESTGTTDNTDSTGDSASHKLQQMRGDSGYKSLETQQSNAETSLPPTSKRHIHFALTEQSKQAPRSSSLPETHAPTRHHYSRSHYFDRRAVKSASKKRREFRSEKQNLKIQECVHEAESDSKSDQPSGDSFEEKPRKFSIFAKVGRSRSDQSPRRANLSRDYSVDERTDALFNEFLRFDPGMEKTGNSSPKSHIRGKLMRKNSEAIESTRMPQKLGKSGRSASVDQSCLSTVRILKALSPQDSIEEECAEVEEIMKQWAQQDAAVSGQEDKTVQSKEAKTHTEQQLTDNSAKAAAAKLPTIRLHKQQTTEV